MARKYGNKKSAGLSAGTVIDGFDVKSNGYGASASTPAEFSRESIAWAKESESLAPFCDITFYLAQASVNQPPRFVRIKLSRPAPLFE